jgi:histone H1/5
MADVATTPISSAPKVTKAAKPKVAKPKVPEAHPKFAAMIGAAISALNERKGSSRQAIVKYIMANYKVGTDQKAINSRVKVALKSGLAKTTLKNSKGVGAVGSFKNVEKSAAVAKPKKSPVKKVAAKKPKTLKKSATPKKAVAKKAKTPVKPKTVKPKSAAAMKPTAQKKVKAAKVKTPAKKVAKKIVKKTPAKKVAKKAAPAKK